MTEDEVRQWLKDKTLELKKRDAAHRGFGPADTDPIEVSQELYDGLRTYLCEYGDDLGADLMTLWTDEKMYLRRRPIVVGNRVTFTAPEVEEADACSVVRS